MSSCNQLFFQNTTGSWMMGDDGWQSRGKKRFPEHLFAQIAPIAGCRSDVAMAIVISDDERVDEDRPP